MQKTKILCMYMQKVPIKVVLTIKSFAACSMKLNTKSPSTNIFQQNSISVTLYIAKSRAFAPIYYKKNSIRSNP